MEMKGLMGGFYRISEWIMRLAVTNLLWIICSSPFLILLWLTMLMPSTSQETPTLIDFAWLFAPAMALAPFTFFPATAAMFSVARKWIMGEADVPLFKTFFKGYKANYLQSMLGGLLFDLMLLIFVVNIYFYKGLSGLGQLVYYVFLVIFVFFIVSLFNYFSMLVHFHMKFWAIVKNAFLFSIGRPLTSLSILVMNAAILYISIYRFNFLLPFFTGSLIAYSSFWNFYRVLSKMMADREKAEEEAGEAGDEALRDEERTLPGEK